MFRTNTPSFDKTKQNLIFQVIDASTEDYGLETNTSKPPASKRQKTGKQNRTDPKEFIIRLFGVTKAGTSVSVRLHDFKPSFYLALPPDVSNETVTTIITFLKTMSYPVFKKGVDKPVAYYSYNDSLVHHVIVSRIPFYGFTNQEQRPYLLLQFKNHRAMQRCLGVFRFCLDPESINRATRPVNKTKIRLHSIFQELYNAQSRQDLQYRFIYEANIDPLLRFFHRSKTTCCGWVRILGPYCTIVTDDAECQWNFRSVWGAVRPVNNKSIAPLVQASFDIECISEAGGFPVPESPNDRVIQIATTFQRYGEESCFFKHIICLGPCDRDVLDSDVELEIYDTEAEVLLAWQRLLRKTDPDILYGYNIFGFDLRYMMVRAKLLGVIDTFSLLGRIKRRQSTLSNKGTSSKQHGFNDWHMVDTPGIVQIDLLPVMRTDHKLPRYTLNYVSEVFLGEKKLDVKPEQIFEFYQSGDPKQVAKVANYCVQDTLLPQRLVNKLKKLTNLIEKARVSCVPLSWLITRGQQIQVFSLLAKYAEIDYLVIPTIARSSHNSFNIKRKDKGYQGATVLSAKSGAYFVPVTGLDFMSLYPTIMIDWNLCHSTLVEDDKRYGHLPGVIYHEVQVGPNTYKFAESVKGLLPKILIHLLKSRGVAKKDMANAKTRLERDIANGRQLAFKLTCNSVYGFCGAEAGGFMPCKPIAACVTRIGRGMISDSLKFAEDTNNFPELANYNFRLYTDKTKTQVCKYGAEVIYGDTDSIYTKFDTSMLENHIDKRAYSMEIGKIVSKKITEFLRNQNPYRDDNEKWTELEYEKVYDPICLFTKKRYAGYIYEKDPTTPSELDKKGIVLKRRDNCIYLKEVYGGCIKIVFDDSIPKPQDRIQKALEFVHEKVDDLLEGKVPIEKLIITQKLNHTYKSKALGEEISLNYLLDRKCHQCECKEYPNCRISEVFVGKKLVQIQKCPICYPEGQPEHVDLNYLHPDITKAQVHVARKRTERNPGDKPASNDRIPYVFRELSYKEKHRLCKNRNELLQCDVAEDPDYVIENHLKLNYLYYLEKQLEKPLKSLFEILIDDAEHMFDRQKMGVQDITQWFNTSSNSNKNEQDQNIMRKKPKVKKNGRRSKPVTQTNTLMNWLQQQQPDKNKK